MLSVLALGLVERAVNAGIQSDAATQYLLSEKLAGKSLRLVSQSPQLSIDVFFDSQKIRIEPTPLGQPEQQTYSVFEQRSYDSTHSITTPDCTLSVTHLVDLLGFMGEDIAGNLPISGDMRVLQNVKHVLEHSQLNLGQLLQPFIGASFAGQLQQVFEKKQTQLKQKHAQTRFYGEEWLKEDNPVLAKRWQMNQFKNDLRTFRTHAERQAARLDVLLTKIKAETNTQPNE